MSLEDSPHLPPDIWDLGGKAVTVLPGNIVDVTPQLHVANHHEVSNTFYVQVIPVYVLPDRMAHTIIHLIPKSREDELVPKSAGGNGCGI